MPSVMNAVVPLVHMLSGSQEVLALGTLIPDEGGNPVLHMHAAAGWEGRATVGCTLGRGGRLAGRRGGPAEIVTPTPSAGRTRRPDFSF